MRRFSPLYGALALVALAACDTPTEPAPAAADAPAAFATIFSPEFVAPTVAPPAISLGTWMSHSGSAPVVYDFNDLPDNCVWDNDLTSPYQDLTVSAGAKMATCSVAPGDIALVPANSSGGQYDVFAVHEVRFGLPHLASSATISSLVLSDPVAGFPDVVFTAYDASGNVLASTVFEPIENWETQTLTAGGIASVGLSGPQAWNYWNDLVLEYSTDPEVKSDCMKGGWEQYGFKNQGQCVRFVETGKDSR